MAQRYQHQLRITVTTPQALPPIPAGVEVVTYRIVHEAVHNVVKHAQASPCTVTLRLNGALLLSIVDDGVGLKEGDPAGVGLISMKERAAELGRRCSIQSLPGGGTRVSAVLPLPLEGPE